MKHCIGQTVGHHHILEKVGMGGMSVAHEACDVCLECRVAFEIISSQKQHTEKIARRFGYEAKTLVALSHLNIVKTIESSDPWASHFGIAFE